MNFFLNPDQGSPSTLGGKDNEKSSLELKRSNARCWKANVKKMEFQRSRAHTTEKIKSEQEQNKDDIKTAKRNGKTRKKERRMKGQ